MNVAVTVFLKFPHNLVRTGMYWFWEVKLNFYTIILKSAAGRIEPLSGPHLAHGHSLPITALKYLSELSFHIQRGAGKSLAQPGRRQATVTKLGIYSTYSPWNSIHFLDPYSNFRKPPKKIQKVVHPTRSPRQQWPLRQTKNGDLSIVFSVQGTGGSPTGPDLENRVGDQDTGSPGRPVSCGLQVPGELGHYRARTRPPWWPSRPAAFFLQNVLQLHQQK